MKGEIKILLLIHMKIIKYFKKLLNMKNKLKL